MIARRLRATRLVWKILLPFVTLMLGVAVFGTFFVTRTVATRAASELDQELSRRTLEVRSTIRDWEVALLEAVTLTANLEGMAASVTAGDAAAVERLAQSVIALKRDVGILAVTDTRGRVLARFGDAPPVDPPHAGSTVKHADIVTGADGLTALIISAPICAGVDPCGRVGDAVVGAALATVIGAASVQPVGQPVTVTVYDTSGALVGKSGSLAPPAPPIVPDGSTVRRSHKAGGADVATLYSPFTLQGRPVGVLAVTVPSGDALSSARGAAVQLAIIVLLGLVGTVAAGALVTRYVLRQVRPLVSATSRLGTGDFTTRVPVTTDDELGELARGVNTMADQLRASYETLESRVDERTAEVRRLLQERTEFFASISHELRTPLAVVIAQAELLRDDAHQRSPRAIKDGATVIGDAAAQLLALVNDILDLARAEAGRLAITIVDADLADIIDAARPTIEGLSRAGELELFFDVERPLPVRVDPARIRAVLVNLAVNAAKYTPPRGSVTVTARRLDRGVEVSVADTGIGVPREIGERLFEPFFRVPTSETQRGEPSSGLGLALARRLVEAHHGTISYVSDGASGTTFTVTLPAGSTARRRITLRRTARR